MMNPELQALVTGFAIGLPASILFFAGLALGMRKALGSSAPALWLLLSFLVRTTLLVAVAVYLIRTGEPLPSLSGFVLAFIIVRVLAVRRAKAGAPEHKEQKISCN